jgi:hypothetical protein
MSDQRYASGETPEVGDVITHSRGGGVDVLVQSIAHCGNPICQCHGWTNAASTYRLVRRAAPQAEPPASEGMPFKVGDRVRHNVIGSIGKILERLPHGMIEVIVRSVPRDHKETWSEGLCTLFDTLVSPAVAPAAGEGERTGPYGHLPITEIATKVRMLCRSDLDHEAVCVAARDAIVSLAADNERLTGERDAYAREALIALAGAVCTPEKGFVADGGPGLMADCIRRLRDNRNALVEQLESVEAQLAAAREVLRESLGYLRDLVTHRQIDKDEASSYIEHLTAALEPALPASEGEARNAMAAASHALRLIYREFHERPADADGEWFTLAAFRWVVNAGVAIQHLKDTSPSGRKAGAE